jgi:predicted RNA-binding protein YlqC (UPF0109 family)
MRALIELVARGLVEDPAAVRVEEETTDATRVYRLQVAPADVGRVIGKHGRTAHALRLLLAASAQRRGCKAALEIRE